MAGGSDNELTVDKVTRGDHCDGFYTCEVSNKQLSFKVHHCLRCISKYIDNGCYDSRCIRYNYVCL